VKPLAGYPPNDYGEIPRWWWLVHPFARRRRSSGALLAFMLALGAR
jgi:hypothetical protein